MCGKVPVRMAARLGELQPPRSVRAQVEDNEPRYASFAPERVCQVIVGEERAIGADAAVELRHVVDADGRIVSIEECILVVGQHENLPGRSNTPQR